MYIYIYIIFMARKDNLQDHETGVSMRRGIELACRFKLWRLHQNCWQGNTRSPWPSWACVYAYSTAALGGWTIYNSLVQTIHGPKPSKALVYRVNSNCPIGIDPCLCIFRHPHVPPPEQWSRWPDQSKRIYASILCSKCCEAYAWNAGPATPQKNNSPWQSLPKGLGAQVSHEKGICQVCHGAECAHWQLSSNEVTESPVKTAPVWEAVWLLAKHVPSAEPCDLVWLICSETFSNLPQHKTLTFGNAGTYSF